MDDSGDLAAEGPRQFLGSRFGVLDRVDVAAKPARRKVKILPLKKLKAMIG